LQLQKNNPLQQCRDLLTLLHKSKNPQAFIQLYRAIENEPYLGWLIEELDNLSVVDLLKQLYINDSSGEYQSGSKISSLTYSFC